jgi:hypothetical protein
MLASITPLGERSRHGHWPVTVSAFLLGALGAAALTGAGLGALGGLALAGTDTDVRLVALTAALLVAAGLDGGPWRVPGPRRQVDERWLDRYRGWVYGLGYGAQLGTGAATVVTSAATYVALLAAFLTASAAAGALIVGAYGAIRGLTPLAAAGVRTPEELLAFHVRLDRARPPVARAGTALLGGAFALALALIAALS